MTSIIVSPSLDPALNVSGISSITQFIISNNPKVNYLHFELGKKDKERGGIFRVKSIFISLIKWNKLLSYNPNAIIHYNFPLSKPAILRDPLFMYIARKRKMKMIIHIHGGNYLTATDTPLYIKRILKKVFSLPVPIIVLSDFEKNILYRKYKCKDIHILPNCINLEEASDYIKEYKSTNSPLVIGYLGKITETKGMKYLLEACKTLRKQKIPFILRIAGKEDIDNQFLPIFKKELGNYFIYDGIVSGKSKDAFLKSLDIFILPSFFEGLPMSLLECMSFGVVPITTNVGSISEIITDKYNGMFVNVKNSKTIVEQFISLNYNRDKLQILSQNARNTIFSLFNPFNYINNLNLLYSKLIKYD